MRMLSKALTVVSAVTAVLAGTASPALANHQCVSSDLLCLITPATTIPVGTPAAGPFGGGAYRVPVGAVCLPECETVYVTVPGAYVSSAGATLVTIGLPEYGVRVDATGFPWIHGGIPAVTPSTPGGAGVELVVQASWFPVQPGNIRCNVDVPPGTGPVTASISGCIVTIRVTL